MRHKHRTATPETEQRPPCDALSTPPGRQTRVTKTLWPTQAGCLQHGQLYGEKLVCVRYRQDAPGLRRYTTVELVVDVAWIKSRKAREQTVAVDIAYEETELRNLAKARGARWNPKLRAWEMTGAAAQNLSLADRAHTRRKK